MTLDWQEHEVLSIISERTNICEGQVEVEPVRVDEYTEIKYTFFCDPDNLPLELYEE